MAPSFTLLPIHLLRRSGLSLSPLSKGAINFAQVFPFSHLHTHTSSSCGNSEVFEVSPEVREAVVNNAPVVALESAIITHGMPFPDNIDTALRLEKIIRESGAVPATVGVLEGRLKVGLHQNEIERLGSWRKEDEKGTCQTHESLTVKVSRRDFPFVMTHKLNGGTTVAGTIIACVKAGIPIFATGGLGGVHRGAETTFDISADLKELGRNPVGVVSAGVKSILDIGKTLEYLETEGICVAVLQKESHWKDENLVAQQIGTAKFPSFFTPQSPFTSPYSVRSEMEAAHLLHSSFSLQLNSGVLIAVPIPEEEGNSTGETIENAIREALQLAESHQIKGKDITPFLLNQVNRLTGGLSLVANNLLIENNVRTACQIAHNLSHLRSGNKPPTQSTKSKSTNGPGSTRHDRPVIIGGTSIDVILSIQESDIVEDGRTHLTNIRTYPGGVGRNVAEALRKLDLDVVLISAVGDDLFGREIMRQLRASNMNCSGIKTCASYLTAVYAALLRNSGECVFGMGDMTLHNEIGRDVILEQRTLIESAPIVVFDANIPMDSIETLLKICTRSGTPVWFEPTEIRKAGKICKVPEEYLAAVTYISPNFKELESIVNGLHKFNYISDESKVLEACFQLFPNLKAILLTRGKDGIQVISRSESNSNLKILSHPAPQIESSQIVSVSGAGDCLNAGFIFGLLKGFRLSQCAEIGTHCATQSLKSLKNVPDSFELTLR